MNQIQANFLFNTFDNTKSITYIANTFANVIQT